jgi:Spy/CpxP family protein refolding chaperone
MKNTKARLEALALFLMVFVLGVTFGAVGNHVWNQRVSGQAAAAKPKPTRDQVLQDLTERLQLTPEQQKQIGAAIDDTRAKWQDLSAQHTTQREVILQQFRAYVRATLTPDQQVKYDEYLKYRDEQRKKEAEKQSAH